MEIKNKVVNHKLRSFMTTYGLTTEDLSKIINKTPNAVAKKINSKKFTQNEMQSILESFKVIDRKVDLTIFDDNED